MSKLMHNSILSLAAILTLTAVSIPSAHASQPKALLVNPGGGYDPYCSLPKFGFDSFNIGGVGERVTFVQWGGLAAQMGLEPGDTILSMNGFALSYHGAWNDALLAALQNGGLVQVTIRDVRTGWLAQRQLFLGGSGYGGGYGPITQKYVTQYGPTYGPTTSKIIVQPTPVGPITSKMVVKPQNNPHVSVKDVIKMFKE